jgi:hypothetical protein
VRRALGLLAAAAAFLVLEPAAAATPPPPTVAPVVAQPSRQLTQCVWLCFLRDLVAGAPEDLVVAFHQQAEGGAVTVADPQLILQRDHGASVERLSGTTAQTPERALVDVSGLAHPDHYAGTLTVQPSGSADPIAVPVTVDVREGPELALMALVVAVVAGWGLSRLLGIRPKVAFRSSALGLRDRIADMPASERAVLTPLWEDTWRLRTSGDGTARAHIDSLSKGTDALRRARDLQDTALREHDALYLVPWVQRMGNATNDVIEAVRSYAESFDAALATVQSTTEQLGAAEQARRTVEDLEARAEPASGVGAPYDEFQAAAKAVTDALAGVSPEPSLDPPGLDPLLAVLRERFATLETAHGGLRAPQAAQGLGPAGIGAVAAQGITALGWPVAGTARDGRGVRLGIETGLAQLLLTVAGLAALIVLLAVGFKTTYLDNPTFGAALIDYLKLAFWGVAAYGSQTALTGLGAAPAAS